MVSNLDKTRRRAKIKCLHFIFRGDEVLSQREIDAQKRVIFEIKSPFNFIFEPEFSTGSPVGDPGGTRTEAKRGPSPRFFLYFVPTKNGDPGGTRTLDTKLKRLVL